MQKDLYHYIQNFALPKKLSLTPPLKILVKRIINAKNAYLLLIDNKYSTDAILVAGHILELTATIVYITDKENAEKNTLKYINKSTLKNLYSLFSNKHFAEAIDLQNDIQCMLSTLSSDGYLVINKKTSENEQVKKILNDHIINILKDDKLSYKTKANIIKEFYELPIVNDYLNHLYKYMDIVNKEKPLKDIQKPASMFNAFYAIYCEIKHASIFCCSIDEKSTEIKEFDADTSLFAVALCLAIIKERILV